MVRDVLLHTSLVEEAETVSGERLMMLSLMNGNGGFIEGDCLELGDTEAAENENVSIQIGRAHV